MESSSDQWQVAGTLYLLPIDCNLMLVGKKVVNIAHSMP
jgi:hypothetical protein